MFNRQRDGLTVMYWREDGSHVKEERLVISDDDRSILQKWYEDTQNEDMEDQAYDEDRINTIARIVEEITGDDQWKDMGLSEDVSEMLEI